MFCGSFATVTRCPPDFSAVEKAAYASLDAFYKKGFGYADMMNTRPQTLGLRAGGFARGHGGLFL